MTYRRRVPGDEATVQIEVGIELPGTAAECAALFAALPPDAVVEQSWEGGYISAEWTEPSTPEDRALWGKRDADRQSKAEEQRLFREWLRSEGRGT